MLMTTDPGDLVLDPTCGSGTTAYVAEQWGRRWITIDTSRVALALARQRLMGARFSWYLLADSAEGRKKESELTGSPCLPPKSTNDIRHGFVYERVQHITLKSIANNPDIKEGMSREEIDAAIRRHAEFELLHDRAVRGSRRRSEYPGRSRWRACLRIVRSRSPAARSTARRSERQTMLTSIPVTTRRSSRRFSPTSARRGYRTGARTSA